MAPTRSAGVLLHVTSLPGPGPAGSIGADASAFLRWLERAGFSAWQMLPLGPLSRGNSPYSTRSTFAGEPMLVDPRRLVRLGLLDPADVTAERSGSSTRTDYPAARRRAIRTMRRAWARFPRRAAPGVRRRLERFESAARRDGWLEDWALFAALKRAHRGRGWTRWDADLRDRRPAALRCARRDLRDEIGFQSFAQFVFFEGMADMRREARDRGIELIGDLPIYVSHDSADVWAHRRLFKLDAAGKPAALGGVPPDYFTAHGQLWHNPVFDWRRSAEEGHRWWVRRVRHQLTWFDRLRLDHFRGFAQYWEVPAGRRDARGGRWVDGPGEALFERLRDELGRLPLIAEDLGVITEDVERLRRKYRLPGIRVVQFAFDDPRSPHRPENHPRRAVAYTGTHDNDTVRGWFAGLDRPSRRRVLAELRATPSTVVRAMIRATLGSPAQRAIVPAQDLFELGSTARMNVPGVARGNWTWRLAAAKLRRRPPRGLRRALRDSGRLRD